VETWLWLAGLVIQAIIFGTIFRKAGYSGWLGLLMAVPLVNLAALLWFATSTWPLEILAARGTAIPFPDDPI
jgi:hypothetical protein